MIIGEHINQQFGGVPVLNDISLKIPKGEITVLIGPSGSGKTTLLKSLSLVENPAGGRVTIGGESYSFPRTEPVRTQFNFDGSQQLGVVFQNLDLIPHWTNRENMLMPLKGPGPDSVKLEQLIDILKLERFLDKYPHRCSRGEQQRIAIARAFMLNPQYLFLDEVTSALDPELIAAVFKYLMELRTAGIGIFIITHFLLFAQNVADTIIFMQNGSIIEQGKSAIMNNPQSPQLKAFLESLDGILINNRS